MEVLKTIILMCLFLNLTHETTQYGLNWNSTIRTCGSHLYDYLAFVCNHEYNDRSSENNLESPSSVSGPVDECCKRPCKLRDLKAYCKDPSIPEENLVAENTTTIIDAFTSTITDTNIRISTNTVTTTTPTSLDIITTNQKIETTQPPLGVAEYILT